MSTASPSTDRWVVSTRVHGEVLTAEAHIGGLEVRLLGLPEGFSQAEIEGWIASLAAAAIEGAGAATPEDPLPPPLRQALSGLLFSHAELWQTTKPLCSIALMRDHGRVAFGWIGQASVEIYVAGERITPEWTLVRDHLGGEARAWSGDARRDTRVEIVPENDDVSAAPLARLLAHWPGEEPRSSEAQATEVVEEVVEPGEAAQRDVAIAEISAAEEAPLFETPPEEWETPAAEEAPSIADLESIDDAFQEEPAPHALPSIEQPAIEAPGFDPLEDRPSETGEGTSEESEQMTRPSHGVARWLSRTFGRPEKMEDAPAPAVLPRADEPRIERPAAHETAPAAQDLPSQGPQSAGPPPLSSVAPRAEGEEAGAAEDFLPPEVPEQIPPSPEPATLTARTVRESFPLDDPRAITLPTHSSASPPPSAAPPAPPRNPEWAATLEALGAREPQGMSPAIRERIRRSRSHEGGWEPLEIETLVPSSGWTGAESAAIPEPPEPEPGQPGESSSPGTTKRGIPRRPDWPTAPTEKPIAWGRWALWTLFVLLLFGGGWMMGTFQNNETGERRPSGFALFLRQIGLGGARFDAHVGSHPAGARISVDGKDTGLRTPAMLSLAPGAHRLDLSLGNFGGASFRIEGKKGDEVPVNAPLWGSVRVAASDPDVPVAVAVDGVARGFVPATIDSLSPGPHELRFTGPGMASWGTAIEVRVGELKEVLAYPLQSPATGLLQVRAIGNSDGDRQPLDGARVSIDGKPRGFTPLTLELARGPHSVRVSRDKEEAPIQVIDLPGGNQRFATFEFGLVSDFPRIELRVPPQFSLEEPVLVSASIANVAARELREMWLHVRSTDGTWRRYEMTLLQAQSGAVGAAPFPATVLNAGGSALYYVSAVTTQGDEIFTELQTAVAARSSGRP